jgi:protocatechuate 3,4-dioxygenase beta subunit
MDIASPNCTLTPETTEGPYWVDNRLERSNVTEGQEGVPLGLDIWVHEAGSPPIPCAGAVVDIWQANALGLYSDQPDQPGGDTGGETFLRGYQLTGEDGSVRFETIFPGWYEGRTLHIHVRVREVVDGEVANTFTSQIFFDEAINETVLASSPYDQRPGRDTTNDEDTILVPELIASTDGDPESALSSRFWIRLADRSS